MNTKLLGGVLLIVGTSIGAGMLALPIAAAELGFWNSTLLLLAGWLVMTFSALLILEVNLWLPRDSNIVAMAKSTLGRWGQAAAWIIYLLLFYSLISAYMAGGGDFLHNILAKLGLAIPRWVTSILFTVIFGYIVYRGIQLVDYVNRGLMFTKFSVYILLVAIILFFISPAKLLGGNFKYFATGITVMLTSFGFANIIPSLRSYFHDDVKKLRQAILIGSLIPLVCYILWDLVIMGVIPRAGHHGLVSMLHSSHSTSTLANTLSNSLNIETLTVFIRIFTSICLATSFMGVSLALSDFLADGLKIPKRGIGSLFICAATFLPPLIVVLIDPRIFITALSYAGIYCVILLVLMPALMTWQGRYIQKLESVYEVAGGKIALVLLMAVSVGIIAYGVIQSI